MSRWRLRERIFRKLGRIGGQPDTPSEAEVAFLFPDGSRREVSVEAGYTLAMASSLTTTPIHTPCPDGTCGDCRVVVEEGLSAIREPSEVEAGLLDAALGKDRDPKVRLGCHARLERGGAVVRVDRIWSLEDVQGTSD